MHTTARDPIQPASRQSIARQALSHLKAFHVEHFMNNMRSTTMRREPAPTPVRRPEPIRRGITSGQRLAQALFDVAGPLARLVRHGETQWASATFTGARHNFILRFEGHDAVQDAERLAIAIADGDITIRGALIADLAVTRFTQTMLPHPVAEMEIAGLLLDQN